MATSPVYNNPLPLLASEIPTRAQDDENGIPLPLVSNTPDPGPPTWITASPSLPYPEGSPSAPLPDPYPVARLLWEEPA